MLSDDLVVDIDGARIYVLNGQVEQFRHESKKYQSVIVMPKTAHCSCYTTKLMMRPGT